MHDTDVGCLQQADRRAAHIAIMSEFRRQFLPDFDQSRFGQADLRGAIICIKELVKLRLQVEEFLPGYGDGVINFVDPSPHILDIPRESAQTAADRAQVGRLDNAFRHENQPIETDVVPSSAMATRRSEKTSITA